MAASPQENAPVSPQPSPQETNRAWARPPRRLETGGNGGERADSGFRCAALCFHLPRRSKKKPPPVQLGAPGKSAQEPDASAPRRVTFLASASLSTWWPSSPSAAAGGAPGNNVVVGRRASTTTPMRGGGLRASSSSFSYLRRSKSSSRVMPEGAASARESFSFPSSPVSASSCMSTPKLAHGCQPE